jgi:hypothetical protein
MLIVPFSEDFKVISIKFKYFKDKLVKLKIFIFEIFIYGQSAMKQQKKIVLYKMMLFNDIFLIQDMPSV